MATIGETRQPLPQARGVLHRLPPERVAHARVAPPADLADRIEHFWRVSWDLAGEPPRVQATLPHPNVHLVLEPGASAAWGVQTGRWTRVLQGRSQVFGIKLRPGAFRGLLGRPVSTLADATLPLHDLFGGAAATLESVLDLADIDEAAAFASGFLRERLPDAEPASLLAGRIVDSVVDDAQTRSAQALAGRFGMSLRSLQRLFGEQVGVGPKWVIRRYRLHEALARVQAGEAPSWAALAQDLGWFDQAHFSADFRRLVGCTPGAYARGFARA